MLKIAPRWPLTGSVYTAIIKAVPEFCQFLGGTSGGTSCDIDLSWRLIYGFFFCRQKKCTSGRHKNTRNAATQLWYRCHTFLGLIHTISVLGTARLQHGFGSILFTLAGEKVLSQAGTVPARWAQLGSAWCWHALVTFTLPLLIMPSCAGTVLAQFQEAV